MQEEGPWDCRTTVSVAELSAPSPIYRHLLETAREPPAAWNVQDIAFWFSWLLDCCLFPPGTFLEIAEMHVAEARGLRKLYFPLPVRRGLASVLLLFPRWAP